MTTKLNEALVIRDAAFDAASIAYNEALDVACAAYNIATADAAAAYVIAYNVKIAEDAADAAHIAALWNKTKMIKQLTQDSQLVYNELLATI